MTSQHRLAVAFAVLLAAPLSLASTLPVERITGPELPVAGDENAFRLDRAPYTSQGKILFYSGTKMFVYEGGPGFDEIDDSSDSVAAHVFTLGPGTTPGSVIAGYRRGNGYGVVSVDGNDPVLGTLNPESVSVHAGCAFMTLQLDDGNQTYRVHPDDIMVSNGDPTEFAKGAARVVSSNCKAAWTWIPLDDNDPQELHYWNGVVGNPAVVIAYGGGSPSFAGDWLVYSATVGGVSQVFAVDTTAATPTPVQISSNTDATLGLTPVTDGRHVAWWQSNATTRSLVMYGGLTVPTGELEALSANEVPFRLDRGQLLWKETDGVLRYYDGNKTLSLDPSPSTTVNVPWLKDGYIVFTGIPNDIPEGDPEIRSLYRATGTPPSDSAQPSPPMFLFAENDTSEIDLQFDRILGATSYNLYVSEEPGLTKANYASLDGGRKITGITTPYAFTDVEPWKTYYFGVTVVEDGTEGPLSKVVSKTFVGPMTWQSVGGLGALSFYSAAADPNDASFVFAGADGSVFKSSNGGVTWTDVLTSSMTIPDGDTGRTAALAVANGDVFANIMDHADIWKGTSHGSNWGTTPILEADGFGELNGALAVDPSDPQHVLAGDFILDSKTPDHSLIIRSLDGGGTWAHCTDGGSETHAYALAFAPSDPMIVYAGGSGTPNLSRSSDGGVTWTDDNIDGAGSVYSIAVDPNDPDVVYATSRDHGVFKSVDGGGHWEKKSNGLTGLADETFVTGDGFNSIIVDPDDSNHLHLGSGNGYWYSTDAGENWIAANNGMGASPYIYALALTPGKRLLAATGAGLFLVGVGPQPELTSITPAQGHISGGSTVTITGSNFMPGSTVTFDGLAATNVSVTSRTSITATVPAHAAETVDVTVTNFDRSDTLAGAFTYYGTAPSVPANVIATATSGTSVNVSWNPVTIATIYRIQRRGPEVSGTFGEVGTSTTTSFTDTSGLIAGRSYFYRVVAENEVGTSAPSAQNIATTVVFSNEPLAAGNPVRNAHMNEARTAVNAMRRLAGLAPQVFTDPSVAGLVIEAVHFTELRNALDAALGPLGLTAGGYTDPSLAGVVVKRVHMQQLRDRMK